MPELPEVEAVTRRLRREAVGAVIRSVTVFRARSVRPQKPEQLQAAVGYTIEKVKRTGKTMVLWLGKRGSPEAALRAHLGMTGNLHVIPDARMHSAITRVLFTFRDGRGLALDDLRLFGSVQLYAPEELQSRLSELGVDPLTKAFTLEFFMAAAKRSNQPAKVFLMDQHPITGLGNIYSAEALFRARINPSRPLAGVRRNKLAALFEAIPAVLRDALRHTVKSYRTPGYTKEMGYHVYGRKGEPCHVCRTPIARIEQAGRSTYFCPKCQKGT